MRFWAKYLFSPVIDWIYGDWSALDETEAKNTCDEVCITYALTFKKVKTEEEARKLLSKSLETPQKPAKKDEEAATTKATADQVKIAAEFNKEAADDDVHLERHSERRMFFCEFCANFVLTIY